MEVIQRIGYDSFCPDNGVLLAKNKDREGRNGGPNQFNCFNWVIDAHPEDINMIDFVRPDGTKIMRTIADYRQLNDALFHAGLNSGSEFEYVDTHNRLHFYILDLKRNEDGINSYTIAVRSLDGQGPHERGVEISEMGRPERGKQKGIQKLRIKNTGLAGMMREGIHKQDVKENTDADIYRLTLTVDGEGWEAGILHEIVCIRNGEEAIIPVYYGKQNEN